MPLDGDDGEGTPIEGSPEWDSVEQERDYWKAIATEQAALIAAMRFTLGTEWKIEVIDGRQWVVSKSDPKNIRPFPSLGEVIE